MIMSAQVSICTQYACCLHSRGSLVSSCRTGKIRKRREERKERRNSYPNESERAKEWEKKKQVFGLVNREGSYIILYLYMRRIFRNIQIFTIISHSALRIRFAPTVTVKMLHIRAMRCERVRVIRETSCFARVGVYVPKPMPINEYTCANIHACMHFVHLFPKRIYAIHAS